MTAGNLSYEDVVKKKHSDVEKHSRHLTQTQRKARNPLTLKNIEALAPFG